VTRYVPSRYYLEAGVAAALLGAFSAWRGWTWPPAYLAAVLFFLSAAALLYLARRPAIEIHETYLLIGRRTVRWTDIRRLDHIGWRSPLMFRITLFDNSRVLMIYPGDIDSANSLLRHLNRYAHETVLEGIPDRRIRTEGSSGDTPGKKLLESSRYRLVSPEDEAEVERLYQRLKAVRHLDPDSSGDEK
jgi:hypothetical protein